MKKQMNKLKTIKNIYIFVETILGHFKPLTHKKYMKIYSSTDNRFISLKTAFKRIFHKKDQVIILNNLKQNSNGTKLNARNGQNRQKIIRDARNRKHTFSDN